MIGEANFNISSSYSGWIDLFGWGTSGYNHGAVCYQPWSTNQNDADYYAYGNANYNLYDQTGKADWGYNAISNGGNTEHQWRTLTGSNSGGEWEYLFNTRSTASGIRYAKACVNGVNGIILVPDNWSASTYSLNSTNTGNADFSANTISSTVWNGTLEPAGCVFIPAAGIRGSSVIYYVGSCGNYWSSSIYGGESGVFYFDDVFVIFGGSNRHSGCAVRLVQDYQRGK